VHQRDVFGQVEAGAQARSTNRAPQDAVADMLGHARLDTVRLCTHSSAADRERAINFLPYDANQA
jgi:hypothetical protein